MRHRIRLHAIFPHHHLHHLSPALQLQWKQNLVPIAKFQQFSTDVHLILLWKKGSSASVRAAALSATDSASFNCNQSGMLALNPLSDEQARLVRQRAQWTEEKRYGKVPAWRLLQAEKAAATSVFQDVDDDDCDDVEENFGGSSADDCLRIRLTIIRALMRCHRDADAAAAAAVAVGIHPNSASALLWYGRCLLRTGKRTEGLYKLSSCVALGPKSGMGGVWAHKEAAIRLRALRRAQGRYSCKGCIRARKIL